MVMPYIVAGLALCFIIFLVVSCIMVGVYGRKGKQHKAKVNNVIIKHDEDISKLKKDVEYLENYVYNSYVEDLQKVLINHKGLATPKQIELLQRVAKTLEGKEVEHE